MRGNFWKIKSQVTRLIPKRFLMFEGNKRSQKIALTFDDGPDPQYTEKILKILERYKIKATFFFIGKNIEQHPFLVKRVFEEGHLIGGHGYSHKRASTISLHEFSEELKKNQASLYHIIGEGFQFFRPPYGDYNFGSLVACVFKKMTVTLWSVDSRDFERKGKQNIVQHVLKDDIGSGEIFLFHDDNDDTVGVLPEFIEYYQKRGFKFVLLKDLMT